MTLQRLNAPPHELERILLRIALISPSVDSLDSLWAGVATVLARLILQLSYIDTDETIQAMHVWSERQFDSPELRMEVVACAAIGGLTLERLWSMPSESWFLHVHAGIHAATLAGVPVAEYLQGGLSHFIETLRQLRSYQAGAVPPPAAGAPPNVMQEYSFQWSKGSEPIIRGSVR